MSAEQATVLAPGTKGRAALIANARGLAQPVAARQLEMSARSYRRLLAHVAQLLGADNVRHATSLAIALGHITLADLTRPPTNTSGAPTHADH